MFLSEARYGVGSSRAGDCPADSFEATRLQPAPILGRKKIC